MSKQAWIIFAAVVVIGLGVLIYLSRGDSIDVSSIDHTEPIVTEEQIEAANSGLGDRIYGNPEAEATLIAYSDYSCPGCAAFNERLMGVMEEEEYKDNVRVVHRHFPIKTIHPNSFSASAYAEAIALQNEEAFWEYSDRLYKNQQQWSAAPANERDDLLLSFASGLDVELDQVREDAKKSEVIRKVNFDGALGRANGVQATPTILINGEQTDASQIGDAPALRKALDEAIKESGSDKSDEEAKKEEDSKD